MGLQVHFLCMQRFALKLISHSTIHKLVYFAILSIKGQNMFSKIKLSLLLLIFSVFAFVVISSCNEDYFILYRNWRKCFTPEFIPGSGTYQNEVYVTLSCKTSDTTIYFTLDGTEPTTNSTVFTEPIHITELEVATVIKAFAVRNNTLDNEDLLDSDIVRSNYMITYNPDRVLPPEFTPAQGDYDTDQNITITTETPDAIIYYTIDGTPPNTDSFVYSEPIIITGHGSSITVKAIATKAGMINSIITSATYVIHYSQVGPPVFNRSAGSYADDQQLELSCNTTNSTIYYTLNGDDPLTEGMEYTEAIALTNPQRPTDETSYSIRAVAVREGLTNSTETTGTFRITGTVQLPTFDPDTELHRTFPSAPETITMSSLTNNASIIYTTDLSSPAINNGINGSTYLLYGERLTIKCYAHREGWLDSPTTEKTYAGYMGIDENNTGVWIPKVAYSNLGYYGFVYREYNGTYYRAYYNRIDEDNNMLADPVDVFISSGYDTSDIFNAAIAYYQKDATTGYFGVAAVSDGNILFQAINPDDGSLEGNLLHYNMATTINHVSIISSPPCADFTIYFLSSNVSKDARLAKIDEPFAAWTQSPMSTLDHSGLDGIMLAYNPIDNQYGEAYLFASTPVTHMFRRMECNRDIIVNTEASPYTGIGSKNEALLFDEVNKQYIYVWQFSDADEYMMLNEIPWNHSTESPPLSTSTIIDAPDGEDFDPAIAMADDFYGMVWHHNPTIGNDKIYYSVINSDGTIDSEYNPFNLIFHGFNNFEDLDLAYGLNEFGLVFQREYMGKDGVYFMKFDTRPE